VEGSDKPLPPRAQTAQQQADFVVKAIKSRLHGKAIPPFRFHDRGSLVALSDYKTLGVIVGGFRLERLIAKLAYRLLYKQHLLALYGAGRLALLTLAALISRRADPRIKLH
jgi:NADH dehydrogenase